MRNALLILAISLLAGCSVEETGSGESARQASFRIRYVQDERSGLCFAMLFNRARYGYHMYSIAAVPCEKVAALLEKPDYGKGAK